MKYLLTFLLVTQAPTSPTSLTVGLTPKVSASLTLSWKDAATNELGYYVERSSDNITFSRIAQTVANVNSYIDSGLFAGTYSYRVQSFNDSGVSGYSNTASFALGNTPSPTPIPTPAPSTWPIVPTQSNASHIKLALILYNYVGNNGSFPSTAVSSVFSYFSGNSFKNLWAQNSYGWAVFDSVTIYGPYLLQRPANAPSGISLYTVDNSELAGIVARDVPIGTQKNYLYPQFSGPTDNGGGRAIEGMFWYGNGWVNQYNKLQGYSLQFQGYMFGLPFDGTGLSCTSNGVLVPLSTNCTQTLRIGDPVSTKSGFHVSPQFKRFAGVGWLPIANRLIVRSSGSYHINPVEILSLAPMMIDLQLPGEAEYFLEYRVPIGPDASLPSTLWQKILIRQGIALIDMHPPSKNNQGMGIGESLQLPGGHTISLESATLTGADVKIQ